MTIVGYFNWRSTGKGGMTQEKILKDHRDFALASPDHNVLAAYNRTLLKEYPLNEEEWLLSLDELAKIYHPLPKVEPNDAKCGDETQSPT